MTPAVGAFSRLQYTARLTVCGAIGVFGVHGLDMAKLGGWLHSKYQIVTTPMVTDEFAGMRITPNVYTTIDEIDLFADRVLHAIKHGVA